MAQGRNKAFDPSLKNKHDGVAKTLTEQIMKDLFGAKKVTDNVKEDEGKFTDGFWDQKYTMPSGTDVLVEAEMKDEKWWGASFGPDKPFKYSDMDIPFRKSKNKSNVFAVLSTCRTYGWMVTRKAMKEHFESSGSQPKIKKTIYEPSGAPYYSTPVEKGKFICFKDGRWRMWKKES